MALNMHTPEARKKASAARRRTLEAYRNLADEDVLLLRSRGMVPLAIADRVGVGLRRVVAVLRENGLEIPGYLTTSNEPPRGQCCPTCGR